MVFIDPGGSILAYDRLCYLDLGTGVGGSLLAYNKLWYFNKLWYLDMGAGVQVSNLAIFKKIC